MSDRLAGKTAVVAGAGRGIGRATAEKFAAEGAHVWALDQDASSLDELADREHYDTAVLDVSSRAATAKLASRVEHADILFNGVGVVHVGDILNCTEDDFATAFHINVTSMFGLIKEFLPQMLRAGTGSIINMSSVQSSVRGFPQRLAYSTSKAAVIGLTKSVAADYASHGIRCNAICPSTVDTPSMRSRIESTSDPAKTRSDFIARQPVGRMGTPTDIAALAVFLASDESSYMTGTAAIIDGGAAN